MLIFYLIVGPCAWVLMLGALLLGRSRMNRLLLWRGGLSTVESPPHVTILIPAKDEGAGIRTCLDAVLAQDYPSFDVIAIDDRSSDQTGQILDDLAAADARLKVIHIASDALPPGWLGKCHALHAGARRAGGDWLLFVDSDVTLAPAALSKALSLALARKYDAVSILTRLECHGFLERLMLPLLAATWSVMHTISLTNEDHRRHIAAANGQFFLIRRSAYESAGGHESVKDQITEDVELMRRLKVANFKVRFFMGAPLAATRMHSDLRQMFNGWARIFSGTSRRRPWRILGAMAFAIASILTLYPALGWGIYAALTGRGFGWIAGAGSHLVLMSLYLALVYRWSGNRIRHVLLVPMSASILLAILGYALRKCHTGRITWRGSEFSATAKQSF